MLESNHQPATPQVIACPVEHTFDPFDPAYLADPYPQFARVRRAEPVFYAPQLDMYVVTRYSEIESVFLDPVTFSAAIAQAPLVPLSAEAQRVLTEGNFRPLPVVSNLDPPQHARMQGHNARTFSARRLAVLEPSVLRKAEQVIDRFERDGRADLISQLAFPLPADTIFTLIGFPPEDTEQLKGWCTNRLVMTWGRPTVEEQVAVAQKMVSYWHYCRNFVQFRLHERRDDFTSALLHIHDADPAAISQEEIASVIYGFSFAGHETTTNLLANLLRQLLCEDPRLCAHAVEEALRFDTSVLTWRRVTTRATEIGGVPIPAGARLLLLLGSAGRDAEHFADPDRFDICRSNARNHLAFGKGIHFCLGASLARMQARIVLELLCTRLPSLRLMPDQELTFPPNVAFRGPEHLWGEWNVAASN
jgi:cytochrome P450